MILKGSYILTALGLISLALAQPPQAAAQNNPPPVGSILDLAGQPITTTWTNATVSFTAALAATDITFALRNDPAFTGIDDISLTDTTNPSGNLLLNGDFEDGTQTSNGNSSAPLNWTYDNVYGASDGGLVEAGGDNSCNNVSAQSGSFFWCDGAVQSYDAIDQIVDTNVGDTYQISFWYEGAGNDLYQAVSTNGDTSDVGGNGIDVTVYAQGTIPVAGDATPEPASLFLFAAGLAGMGLFGLYRAKKA